MNTRSTVAALCGIVLLAAGGCKKTADNSLNYKSAINDYYTAHPSCLFSEPQKFPVQVDTDNDSKTAGFDALFNQGLLTRKTEEKKKLLGLVQKQVTDYDLSDKGRSAWTSDTQQPSEGNFCYGHREVDSIDSSTPNNGEVGRHHHGQLQVEVLKRRRLGQGRRNADRLSRLWPPTLPATAPASPRSWTPTTVGRSRAPCSKSSGPYSCYFVNPALMA